MGSEMSLLPLLAVLSGALALLAVGTAILALLSQRSGSARPVGETVTVLADTRRRALICLAAGGCLLLAVAFAGSARPDLLGLPLLLAAPLGGALALALFAVIRPVAVPLDGSAIRSASMTPRTAATTLGRRNAIRLLAALVLAAVITLTLGLTSSVDDLGHHRAYAVVRVDGGSSASPYAGWFYGVPLLLALTVLTVVTLLALRRIGDTAALPDPTLAALDRRWRSITGDVVTEVALAAGLLPLGASTAISGLAIHGAHDGWTVPAVVVVVAGLVLIGAALLSAVRAVATAALLPRLADVATSEPRVTLR